MRVRKNGAKNKAKKESFKKRGKFSGEIATSMRQIDSAKQNKVCSLFALQRRPAFKRESFGRSRESYLKGAAFRAS